MSRPLRIANASGFLGDRASALQEMVEGGDVDVVTGDYLAELTMLILGRQRLRDPSAGYAKAFLRQLEPVLATVLDRGIKVVVNAGGLNPAGLAAELWVLSATLGLAPAIATVEGDDLRDRLAELHAAGRPLREAATGAPLPPDAPVLTANAYLGAWGIVAALQAGADIVICPRVTDASLVVGPAVWWHGWGREAFDPLAGAVVAGHVLECGAQATGGNYSGFAEIPDLRRPGFPLAEIAEDGSAVITKHPGTGGAVTEGTVTAQLLYEVGSARYRNPDVVVALDTVRVAPAGPDRVALAGTRGHPPPPTTKVAVTLPGGWRNEALFVLTGLDIARKAEVLEGAAREALADLALDLAFHCIGAPAADARRQDDASALLRVVAASADERAAGRVFSGRLVELALANYPGLFLTAPPGPATAVGRYVDALVDQDVPDHRVVLPSGVSEAVPPPPVTAPPPPEPAPAWMARRGPDPQEPRRRVPLGAVADARSGDKGDSANVGLWVRSDAAYAWLAAELGIRRFQELVPETAELRVERTELANLRALNFVVHGLLPGGAAATTRFDRQAKGLAEFVRSRAVDVPVGLLEGGEGASYGSARSGA